MAKQEVSINQVVKKQIKKWEDQFAGKKAQAEAQVPVITVSMEPGSGGSIIVEKIAKTSEIRGAVINSLEKERLSGVKGFHILTGKMSIDAAVEAVMGAVMAKLGESS